MKLKFIKLFSDIRKEDVSIAGGKGASLGEMYNSSIPVPNGFVILSSTFDKFIKDTKLDKEISLILKKVNINNSSTISQASKKIQTLILSKDLPKDLEEEIQSSFKELNSKFVAVRSSATSEDSKDAAWAGQLNTYLNTTNINLLRNIKNCWASLFTERAIFYRFEKGLQLKHISVAVVVQKMVESEKSGIAFSVHPVTEDPNQLIIEAGFGLGEAIVSGQVTPNSYIVSKKPHNILDKTISEQTRELVRSEKGVSWKNIDKKRANSQVLEDKEILSLSTLIQKIEDHYKFPVDVEWAIEKNMIYITQSRPITTLKEKVKINNKNKIVNSKKLESNSSLSELIVKFKDYFKNKDITKHEGSFSPIVWGTAASSVSSEFYKKYYSNLEFGPVIFISKDNQAVGYFNYGSYLASSEDGLKRYFVDKLSEFNDFEIIKKEIDRLYNKYPPTIIKKLDNTQFYKQFGNIFSKLQDLQIITLFCEALDNNILDKYFNKFKQNESISVEEFNNLVSLVSFDSFLTELDFALINYNKDNPYSIQWAFSDYMITPKLDDINLKVTSLIKDKGGLVKMKSELKNLKEEVSSNKQKINVFKQKLNPNLLKLFEFAQETIKLRDLRKKDFFKCISLVSNFGREFALKINISEDLVPYIIYPDLNSKLYLKNDYKQIIKKRKDGNLYYYDENYFRDVPIDYSNVKKTLFELMDKDKNKEIKGNTAQKGFVTGNAKVILNQSQFKNFKDGDILVTSMTRPEFIPLIKKASAIVTDEGGLTCHAAIISRELKKPCIIGTQNASRLIKDGDLIEVDADNGIIKILKNEPKEYDQVLHHDFPLIIPELTNYGEGMKNIPWSKNKFEFHPYCIFERKEDGILYYYYDLEGVNWKINEAGSFDKKIMEKKTLEGYSKVEDIIINKKALDRKSFITFTDNLKKVWTWWDCMWWTIEYYDKHKLPLDDLILIRKKTENMAPGICGAIRNSLKKIYPTHKKYVDVISIEEVRKNKLPSKEILEKRLKGYIYTNNKIYYSIDEVCKEFNIKIKDHLKDVDIKDIQELKGQTAYPGKVQGIVKKVEKRKDVLNFKKGEIIVSSTTTPDFLPAMKKSVAILSEHGGAICHASITARELKKPCIVGIKKVTHILKDGDLIEVDANKGIIKILRKGK